MAEPRRRSSPRTRGSSRLRGSRVADHRGHLHDDRHQLEHGAGIALPVLVLGRLDPNYAFTYHSGVRHRRQGPADRHRLERHHGLRRHASDHHAGLRRLRQRRHASSLTTKPTCSTTATVSSTVAGSPYTSSCTGAADSNYAFSYVAGPVTVTQAPLTVTASNGTMTYGGTPPAVTPSYGGFVNGADVVVAHDEAHLFDDRHGLERRRWLARTPPRARARPTPTTPSATPPARSR